MSYDEQSRLKKRLDQDDRAEQQRQDPIQRKEIRLITRESNQADPDKTSQGQALTALTAELTTPSFSNSAGEASRSMATK